MAKVDSLSHTHLVRNESTSTALQPLADQDPSREELHGRRGKHTREGEGAESDAQAATKEAAARRRRAAGLCPDSEHTTASDTLPLPAGARRTCHLSVEQLNNNENNNNNNNNSNLLSD
ncbi:hypothetical protein EYF80_032156 [Liparis tanakae]|uniref:Uncharacterized protein n=1 Tax=Liparis tanakae TaxID=230148 RepID=A0A4Z2GVS3_9TELE|nr:hypothetical protein EYF80_032156 [Liparis tanakae]